MILYSQENNLEFESHNFLISKCYR